MKYLASLLAVCLSSGAALAAEIKPDRLVDTWEVTNSGFDRETLTLKANGEFVHAYVDGKTISKKIGRWQLNGTTLKLTLPGQNPERVAVLVGSRPHLDGIVLGRDTIATRSYWVAELKLTSQLSGSMDEQIRGKGYRIGFADSSYPHFAVDLWPMSEADIERLKNAVVAELRKRGLKPVHPIRYNIRGF